MSAFNRLRRPPVKLRAKDAGARLRSTAVPLYHFDFTRGGDWPTSRAHAEAIADGGRVNGVLLWMRLHLDAETVYEVEIGSRAPSSWTALFFPLATPTDFRPARRADRRRARRPQHPAVGRSAADQREAEVGDLFAVEADVRNIAAADRAAETAQSRLAASR